MVLRTDTGACYLLFVSSIFRDGLLQGKLAFITGGGSGIGLGIAQRFAEHGATVILAGRNGERLASAASSIRTAGGAAETVPLDVRDYDALESALEQTCERLGKVDIAVCAAAGNFSAAAKNMSARGFKAVVDIDLLGTYNSCRAVYAHLRKPGAAILNVSANHATRPIGLQAHVCAAKAGLEMLTKTLALEWGPEGIRANCITPGPTDDTEGMRRLAPALKTRQQLASTVPLGRLGTKDELADTALFLVSDAAAYITGAVILCDGGASLRHFALPLSVLALDTNLR